jgi:rubrerythrin
VRRATRRELLAATGVAGAATWALAGTAAAAPSAAGDPGLLARALAFEQLVLLGYARLLAATGPARPGGADAALLREIVAQERVHVATLHHLILEIGGAAPGVPQGTQLLELFVPGLAAVHDGPAALDYARRMEETAIYGYVATVPGLSDAKLVQTAAGIMCDEGQHVALLRERLGRDPIPSALESGSIGGRPAVR